MPRKDNRPGTGRQKPVVPIGCESSGAQAWILASLIEPQNCLDDPNAAAGRVLGRSGSAHCCLCNAVAFVQCPLDNDGRTHGPSLGRVPSILPLRMQVQVIPHVLGPFQFVLLEACWTSGCNNGRVGIPKQAKPSSSRQCSPSACFHGFLASLTLLALVPSRLFHSRNVFS